VYPKVFSILLGVVSLVCPETIITASYILVKFVDTSGNENSKVVVVLTTVGEHLNIQDKSLLIPFFLFLTEWLVTVVVFTRLDTVNVGVDIPNETEPITWRFPPTYTSLATPTPPAVVIVPPFVELVAFVVFKILIPPENTALPDELLVEAVVDEKLTVPSVSNLIWSEELLACKTIGLATPVPVDVEEII
jgi:hypothetical protein